MKSSSNKKYDGFGANPSTQEFNDLYFDKQEVLQKFKISSRTLQDWRNKNLVTYSKVGNKFYYLKESLNKLIVDTTVLGDIREHENEGLPKNVQSEKSDLVSADPINLQSNSNNEQKSFSKLWDPIPRYFVPILIVVIYFVPYIPEISKGKPISPFKLLAPLYVGVVGYTAFFLLQVCIKILRKFMHFNSSQKTEK